MKQRKNLILIFLIFTIVLLDGMKGINIEKSWEKKYVQKEFTSYEEKSEKEFTNYEKENEDYEQVTKLAYEKVKFKKNEAKEISDVKTEEESEKIQEKTNIEFLDDTKDETEITETTEITELTKVSTVKETENIYKYCPTSIDENIFYCSNADNPGKITDGIFLNNIKVLGTTPNSWDSVQVCDPSVICGAFVYNDLTYQYLMAYLGCATYDCTANEIGFAVSNNLYDWTKIGKVVSAENDGFWGVGQPSLLNINNEIYLFYTSGTSEKTTTYVELLDCTNLNNIKHLGKKEIVTNYDFISNADFATEENVLYMICDTHPFADGALNFIPDKQTIYTMPWDKTFDSLNNNWERYSEISSLNTGHLKNHNGCLNRNGYGELISHSAYVTIADEIGDFLDNLWTYRFYAFNF